MNGDLTEEVLLQRELRSAKLKLQEANERLVATAQAAFESGYWAGRRGPLASDPRPDLDTAMKRFMHALGLGEDVEEEVSQ